MSDEPAALAAIVAIVAMETIGLRIPERATKGKEAFPKHLFKSRYSSKVKKTSKKVRARLWEWEVLRITKDIKAT